MTLFDSDPQYREKATIWRMFSMLPLYAALAGGRVFRWFAINIPMDLGTGGEFTSDIDIIAMLHDFPRSRKWLFRTWEVKVGLLCKDGTARSLKVGKTARTLTQLRAYRRFGSPSVSLLDAYVCESGFMATNAFPPPPLTAAIRKKLRELKREQFGYQLLPFEHKKDSESDVGLLTTINPFNPLQTTFDLLPQSTSPPAEPFTRLAARLSEFFESLKTSPKKSFSQIIFCRECRQLQLIQMKEDFECPHCHANLVIQS